MHCFSSRVTSWLTWTLRVGGFVLRRRIGASVIRPSHLGWPTQQQRRSQEAVAVLGSQTIPWDRHRQIERKFCTIVERRDTGSGRWTRIEDSWVVEQRVGWCAMRRGGEPWRGLLIICAWTIWKRGSGRPRIRPRRGTFR